MASKINSRLKNEKAHGAKPYDRPKQSIFRKVASTVRDIFVPSWLLNVPSWSRQNAENTECTKEADDTHIGKDIQETLELSSTRQAKRLKYDPVCDLTPNAHLESASDSWFVPTSREDHAEVHKKLQIHGKEKKDVNLAINGDDHSENSEGSASTSGCSSLVSSHQERQDRFCSSGLNFRDNDLENLREELNGKALFQPKNNVSISTDRTTSSVHSKLFNSSLWSRETEMTLRPHTRPQPMFQSPRPSFNISSFGNSSIIGNSSYDKRASSPFYGGKTAYGGASAYRRAQLSTMPYQLSKSARSRITVKESSLCDDSEHMSSAAKRILNTLEKMSTPIMDVKKIPNRSPVDILSFTPASQRHNKFLPFLKKTQLSSFPKGPPVSAFNKSSNASLLRNHIQLKKNIKMEIPFHGHLSSSSFQSLQDSPPESSSSKVGGGKMRTRINQHLHHSSRAKDEKEMPDEIDLPNIPIPIERLPVINLPVKDKSKDNAIFTSSNCDLSSEGQWNFTFSDPIEYSAPKIVVPPQSSHAESPFVFSSPVVVSEVSSTSTVTQIPLKNDTKNPSKGKETQLYTGSVNDFLRTLSVNKKKNSSESVPEGKPCKTKSSNTYKAGNELLDAASSNFAGGMKSQDSMQKHRPDISENEKNHVEEFTVDTSVSQSTSSTKSISTLASVGFGDRFKPSQNSWNCPTCLILNNITDNKCIACETENPNILKSSTPTALNSELSKSSELKMLQNSNKSFKEIELEQKSGTWTCDTCMIKNALDKMKCIACETPRLSKENTTDLKPSGFKFGSPLPSSSTPGTFKFGSFVMNAVPTTSTSTFKFGIIPEKSSQSSQQTPSSTFKFGVIPNATDASNQETISPILKFGTAPEVTVPSDTKIFCSSSSPVVLNEGFKFNPPVSDAASLNSKKTMSSSNITDTTSSIFGTCNAAKDTAAFKLNVPSVKSQSATESSNVSIAVSQTKSDVHSITSLKEEEEVTRKPLLENMPKDQEQKQIESISDQGNKNLQLVFKGPLAITPSTASSAFKTTTTVSGVGGFTFGNIPIEQSQSCMAFPFANKTAGTKINPSVTAAEVGNIFTSTSTVDSANGSTFSFKNLPTKPFAMVPSDKIEGNSASLQISPVTDQKDNVQPSNFVTIDSTSSTGFMFGNAIAVTASPFQFGTAPTTTVATTTTTAESIAPEVPKSSGVFTFGSAAASDSRDLKQGFTFKSTAEGKPKFSSQNRAIFSAFKQDPGNSVVVSSTTSPFEFGKSLPTPSSSSGFIFGTPKTEVSQTASAPFSFNTDVSKSVGIPHFTGFSQSQPVTTTSTLAFSFGSGVTTTSPMSVTFGTTSTSSNLFSFSAKSNVSAPNSSLNSSAMPSNPTPVFGCSTSQSVFGSNTSSTIPTFGTGLPQKQEMQGGFNFGTNPSAAVTPSSVFKFGSTYGGPVEKKSAGGTVQNAGFNFNLTAQQSDMSGSFSQGFSPSTPLNFNFAAVSASPAPFQFMANTENPTSSNSAPRKYRKGVRRNLRKPND